jgi:hypothetical protein
MEGMEQIAQIFRTPAQQRAFQDVQRLAPFIKQMKAQKAQAAQQERVAPVTNALSSLGQQWQAAATPEAKESAHSQANQVRSNYITGGGSPADLAQQYWGSDPTQGFQGAAGFQAPITGYEGLDRNDTVDYTRDAIAAELKRRIDEAGLTGIDPQTGQATLEGKYKNYLMSKGSGGSGGSGSSGSSKTLLQQAQAAANNDPRLWTGSDDPPEGRWSQAQLVNDYLQQLSGGGGEAGGGEDVTAELTADLTDLKAQGGSLQDAMTSYRQNKEAYLANGIDEATFQRLAFSILPSSNSNSMLKSLGFGG